MDQRIKKLVINSNSIPKSIQTYIPESLCLHNINLFKQYIRCNQMRESFHFTKRYTRFSEFLLPQTTTRIGQYDNNNKNNVKKKTSKLFLKDAIINNNDNNWRKNRLWKQIINSPSQELSYSMRDFHLQQLNFSFSSKTTKTSTMRILTGKPNRFKKIALRPKTPKKMNELIKFRCLFRNDLIKRLFSGKNLINDDKNNDEENENKNTNDHIIDKVKLKRKIKVGRD